MDFETSQRLTVVVLYVSFSYPVLSVRRSISLKLDQMSSVALFVHNDRRYKCKDCSW